MKVFTAVGLSVTAPIQTGMSLILGTSLAALVGGTPAALAPLDLMRSPVCCYFAAAMATVWARIVRDRSLFRGGRNVNCAMPLRDTSRRLIAKNMAVCRLRVSHHYRLPARNILFPAQRLAANTG